MEKNEKFESYKEEWESSKIIVAATQKRLEDLRKERDELEKKRGNIKETFDQIYRNINKKLERQKKLEELIPKLRDPNLPTVKKAKLHTDKIERELSSNQFKIGKQREKFKKILNEKGIPTFPTLLRTAKAFLNLFEFQRKCNS